ncbi:hypothetical protein [Micromonospora profundi]|uniref:hypothetical protein n=1 Tax=Micromonospora profundi TaxID=1420889 RepID=UPI003660CC13
MRIPRKITTAVVVGMSCFGALWTLLEPAGGLQLVTQNVPKTALTYISLALVSANIAVPIAILRHDKRLRGPVGMRHEKSRIRLDVPALLSAAQERVTVVGLSIPTFASEQALRTYDHLLASGVQIDLVLVNPLSPSLLQRPPKLYTAHPSATVTAANSLRILVHFRRQLPDPKAANFRVHTINSLPTTGIIIVDDKCLWHPYLEAATGADSPYITESTSAGFGVHILRYAHTLSRPPVASPATVDADELMQRVRQDSDVRFQLSALEVRTVRKALSL